MTAWIDEKNMLHVSSESVYEALALAGWLEKYAITNVNGINMIPVSHMKFIMATQSNK